jgi:hypothetical protein
MTILENDDRAPVLDIQSDPWKSVRRWAPLLLLASTILIAPQSFATSMPVAWGAFRSLCMVIDVEAPTNIRNSLNVAPVEAAVSRAIESRLRQRQLNQPVESGHQCFPGKVGSAPFQLSLQFHVTLAPNSDPINPIIAVVIMHQYFRESQGPPHEYPTRVAQCRELGGGEMSACLTKLIVEYFDGTALKMIDEAQRLLKGGK